MKRSDTNMFVGLMLLGAGSFDRRQRHADLAARERSAIMNATTTLPERPSRREGLVAPAIMIGLGIVLLWFVAPRADRAGHRL